MAENIYDRVGGKQFFVELVDRFYEGVAKDKILRPMYPPDLGLAKDHLSGFLSQYWGGPPQYSIERGHPRLRMRHVPFKIGVPEREAWVKHMTSALSKSEAPAEIKAEMLEYFESTATFLINQP